MIDLDKGIVQLWESSGLDAVFKAYWITPNPDESVVLLDSKASPAQPFPYCVYEKDVGTTTARSSKNKSEAGRREYREIPVEFHVHARSTTNPTSKSAKQIASELADSVVQVFGGHPTAIPSKIELDHGAVLRVQYQNEHGMKDDDNVYMWIVRYMFFLDVPVAE